MRMNQIFVMTVMAMLLGLPQYARAYIGPGAGISALGTVLAFFGAIILVIVGFIWYPLKRLLAKIRNSGKNSLS